MLRKLTTEEIEDILDFITLRKGIPKEIAVALHNKHKSDLRKQLEGEMIHPKIIPELKKELEKMYHSSIIQAGESVGIMTAQSIGEKNTQTTLNTFHKAGAAEKTVVAGVPRFWELLNATKSPKGISCIIPFKEGNSSLQEVRKTINHSIAELTIEKLVESMDVIESKEEEPWYSSFEEIYNKRFREYSDCISIKFNVKTLYEHEIDMEEIADKIENEYADLACVFSPIWKGRMDVFVNMNNIELDDEQLVFVTQENKGRVYLEEVVLPNLEKLKICGVTGIEHIFYTTDKNGKWIVETEGSNLKELLSMDIVDSKNVICNDMWEIYNTLGVEAARQFLIEEFMGIMAGINIHHVKLMVDRMTFNGGISSISRYAMRNEGSGALGKASFEETLENLLNAAVYGEREATDGVSASIICGKLGKFGTGICELKIDMMKLPQNKHLMSEKKVSEKI